MKIAINCRSFLSLKPTGIGRYAKSLVDNLCCIDSENDFLLYSPKGLFDRKRRLPVVTAPNAHVKPDFFNLGVDLSVGRFDLYHAPSPEVPGTRVSRIAVTVHDLVHKTFPQAHTPETVALTEKAMAGTLRRASVMICVSESTRQDLERFYPQARGRTVVVPNGVDHRVFYKVRGAELSSAQDSVRALGIDGPFVLFVGTLEPRKNLEGVLKAFSGLKASRRFDGKLVVAGMKGWMSDHIRPMVTALGIEKDVIFLGYLTDDELRYLYNLSEVFVFPSFYEGFGYPVVEAMACGAAVVTSNVSSCAEMAAGGALTVDPGSIDGITDAVARLLEDGSLQERLRSAGRIRAAEFSLDKNARDTLAVYRNICCQ